MSTKAMTKIIANYFKTQPVLKAWLFGSYSRGEENEDSDIDLRVEHINNFDLFDLLYFDFDFDLFD